MCMFCKSVLKGIILISSVYEVSFCVCSLQFMYSFILYSFTLNLVLSTFRTATVFTCLMDVMKYMKCVRHHFMFLFSGFVGTGMLSAAVAGSVFASPPPRNILHAIRCVAQGNEGTYNL